MKSVTHHCAYTPSKDGDAYSLNRGIADVKFFKNLPLGDGWNARSSETEPLTIGDPKDPDIYVSGEVRITRKGLKILECMVATPPGQVRQTVMTGPADQSNPVPADPVISALMVRSV